MDDFEYRLGHRLWDRLWDRLELSTYRFKIEKLIGGNSFANF